MASSSTGWKLLAAIGALMLATNACGDNGDKKDPETQGDGDGDSTPAPAKPLLEPNVAGTQCAMDGDCGPTGKCKKELTGGMLPELLGGFIGVDINFAMAAPGNYCSASCKTDADCNTGGACFGILPSSLSGIIGGGAGGGLTGAITGECRKKCEAATDCREGYECAELKDGAFSGIPGFGQIAGFITSGVPKTCQPAPTVQQIDDATVGKACSADTDCGAGSCVGAAASADGGAPTLGACTATCTKDTDCGATEGTCTGIIYGSGGQCTEKCTTNEECKHEGYSCQSVLGVKGCFPDAATTPGDNKGDAGSENDGDASTDNDAGV